MFDVRLYLERLGIQDPGSPSPELLSLLQRRHVSEIPYNNVDILLGRPFDLSEEALFQKTVAGRRGGYCYELTPLLATLLKSLGFRADLVSGRILQPEGIFGPEFDHALIIVHLERRWLADVGNSRWFFNPLCIDEPGWQEVEGRFFRIQIDGEQALMFERGKDGVERVQYTFTFQPRQSADFEGMCRLKWTSPDSKFVRGLTISRVVGKRRIVINRNRMLVSEGQETHILPISGPSELRARMIEFFGEQLDCDAFLDELIQPQVLDALTL